MESQIPHPHGRNYDEDTPNAGLHAVIEGEDGHHNEKQSVMKKVKAKAKKIKETLEKHGHGHDHDHEGEEDDEDEEMVEDPKVHVYESTAVRSAVSGPDIKSGQPMGNWERPSVMTEDRYGRSELTDPAARPFGHRQEEKQSRDKIGMTKGSMEEDPNAPKDRPGKVRPSNYESKVTDPTGTGGGEVGITPILRSLDKMGIYDEPHPKSKPEHEQKQYTGSHDQFSPESVPKSFDPNKPEELPRVTLTRKPRSDQSSHTEKITSAAAVVADKAVAAKDVIASKLGYSGQSESTGSHETAKSASPTEYAHKIAATVTEKLAPVYEKVVDAGSSVVSKVHLGTETGEKGMEGGPDKGVSVKEYLVERFRPGDEDKALSEVITGAFYGGKEATEERKAIRDRREEEPEEKSGEGMPLGKVTESEEVARRLGTGNESSGGGAGNVSSEKGVVDRLKGAVSSWLGKGSESQKSQASMGTSYVTDEGVSTAAGGEDERDRSAGERRLQQSSN